MITPLKTYREKQKTPSRHVAIELNITPSHYRRVEIGETKASPELANRIAKYFGQAVTRDQILYPEDYMEQPPPKKPGSLPNEFVGRGGKKSVPQRLRKAS
jgi:transcriptional regulator with XRE-family HTH domain